MDIVGAGLAGLLAGNMLRHRSPVIFELQDELPNNHSAVLRFRTSAIGDVLNIPFRKVIMNKGAVPWKNRIADGLNYAFKNTGKYRSDRSIAIGEVSEDRWVAPPDLVARMARNLDIRLGEGYKFRLSKANGPIVSTLPMPVLMKELRYEAPDLEFNSVEGINIKATILDCDAYISLLCPSPSIPFSRISITGDELILESRHPGKSYEVDTYAKLCLGVAADLLGLPENKFSDIRTYKQQYAKITPIDDTARKNFLWWATDKFNIFSLGRFATWRPRLLMDDLVNDLRKIDGWIEGGHYSIARHR